MTVLSHTLLGEMKAEFEYACRKIDHQADIASRDSMRGAFDALLAGDTDERDRLCDTAKRAEDARGKAKIEAWLRIGEKHGISRGDAMRWLKKIGH